MTRNFREAKKFDVDGFERSIPETMRYKCYEEHDDLLYWVSEEDFDSYDLRDFKKALKRTPFRRAVVILRDYSNYNFEEDWGSEDAYLIELD